jgi:hypothetical protein
LRAGADQSALVGFKVDCRRHTGRWIFDESSLLSPRVTMGFYRVGSEGYAVLRFVGRTKTIFGGTRSIFLISVS